MSSAARLRATRAKRAPNGATLSAVVRAAAGVVGNVCGIAERHDAAVRECLAVWPIAGAAREDVVKSVSLLVVLRRLMVRAYGERSAEWALMAEVPGVASLAGLCELVERQQETAALLAQLDSNLPVDFGSFVEAEGERVGARLAMSVVYERLLAKFDGQERRRRGVFHTPAEVVRWTVAAARSLAAELLGAHCRVGLGQEGCRPRFVDIGCGCGSFLAELLESRAACGDGDGESFVGYEVLPTAAAIAKWLLARLGPPQESAAVDLRWTNPLLAGEDEANRVLGRGDLPVIVGNPPYANFGRSNRGQWIDRLMLDYRRGLDERKANLGDDFIKFIRWGQHWIDRAGEGVLAVVTSSTYLDGLTHRVMRRSLLESFDAIYLLDLRGGLIDDGSEAGGTGGEDQNVFDVRSGVTVGLFVKRQQASNRDRGLGRVHYRQLAGTRETKLAWLEQTPLSRVDWRTVEPQAPAHSFKPVSGVHASAANEYASYWPITSIFEQTVSGVQTKNDALFVDVDRDRLAERMREWLAVKQAANVSEPARDAVPSFDERLLRPYMVAPLDRRWIYYDRRLLGRARYRVMRHMLQPNVGLVFMRQSTNAGEYDHFLAVDCLVSDRVFYSRHGAPFLALLWLYADEASERNRRLNFTQAWLDAMRERLGALPTGEAMFDYLYAVCHRSEYRRTFAAELKRDFPRLPLPAASERFDVYAAIGRKLRQLHTTADDYSGTETHNAIAMPPQPITIGGYDVLERWLRRRSASNGHQPSAEDIASLQRTLILTHEFRQQIDSLAPPNG